MVHKIYFYDGVITDEVKLMFVKVLAAHEDTDDYIRWITLDGKNGWGLNWDAWMRMDGESEDISVLTNNPDYLSLDFLSGSHKSYGNIFIYDFTKGVFSPITSMFDNTSYLNDLASGHITAGALFISGSIPCGVNPGTSITGDPLRNPRNHPISNHREIVNRTTYNTDMDDKKCEKK